MARTEARPRTVRLRRFAAYAVVTFVALFALFIVTVSWLLGEGKTLETWHTEHLSLEFRARDADEVTTLEAYLAREQALFDELTARVIDPVSRRSEARFNRYVTGSVSDPERGRINYNRTTLTVPEAPVGALLLLHGMTDGPYSLRMLADRFEDRGFAVLNLRLPGHGTTPGELARIDWRDWMAAVRLAATELASRVPPDRPLWILGYSNGAALALSYTLEALEDDDLASPARLVMISPMIDVSPLARVTRWFYWMGKVPPFAAASWLEIVPEYDPHKYNSFPMNGPRQSRALTRRIQAQLDRAGKRGTVDRLPPVLAFQSLVDSTVTAGAVQTMLFDRLPANGSELVFYDVNRYGLLEEFITTRIDTLRQRVFDDRPRDYILSLVSNVTPTTLSVAEWRRPVGGLRPDRRELGLAWPEDVYSLTHVALPFAPDDPIYGFTGDRDADVPFPRIGDVRLLGESGALSLPASLYTRLRANPFHAHLLARIDALVDEVSPGN